MKQKRIFTEEHRKKLSEARKGGKAWNKGMPMSEEVKQKLRKSLTGRKSPTLGKKFTEEHKNKLRNAKLGKPGPWTGKKREHMTGEKHPMWKGGYEHKLHINRRRKAQKKANGGNHSLLQWEQLKAICNYMCVKCQKKEPEIKLTADHIVPISLGGTDSIDNIQPMCGSCNASKGNRSSTKYIINQG